MKRTHSQSDTPDLVFADDESLDPASLQHLIQTYQKKAIWIQLQKYKLMHSTAENALLQQTEDVLALNSGIQKLCSLWNILDTVLTDEGSEPSPIRYEDNGANFEAQVMLKFDALKSKLNNAPLQSRGQSNIDLFKDVDILYSKIASQKTEISKLQEKLGSVMLELQAKATKYDRYNTLLNVLDSWFFRRMHPKAK